MKQIINSILLCLGLFACSKNSNSVTPGIHSVVASYDANITIGSNSYQTSNFTAYNSAMQLFQFDGLNLYSDLPACIDSNLTSYQQVLMYDTGSGGLLNQAFLDFTMPSRKSFSNYTSPFISVFFNNTSYSGTGIVSANITDNGNQTISGSYNINGLVGNPAGSGSLSFSASGNFTNMPY
jgi:hypothetical protein